MRTVTRTVVSVEGDGDKCRSGVPGTRVVGALHVLAVVAVLATTGSEEAA